MAVRAALKTGPIGLVIPAWIFGFWRRMADNSVEPERGRPEMKWMVCCMFRTSTAISKREPENQSRPIMQDIQFSLINPLEV